MRKISIQDIAKLAGVSKTTVSVVLNNRARQYGISRKTEQKVRDVAQKFNYTPHNMARGLRLTKTHTIGMVVPDLSNWFFSQLCGAFQDIVSQAGYRLYITSSNYDEQREYELIKDLLAWNIDGLLVASMMPRDQVPHNVLDNRTPVVYVDRQIKSDYVSWVASDNRQGAYDLVSYLCSKGVREVFYLGGARVISTFLNRFEGYCQALQDHGIAFTPEWVYEAGATASDSYRLMKTMLAQRSGLPEAIFAASCDFIVGLLQFMKDEVGEIPVTLLLGAYGDHQLLDFLAVKIPSVQQDTDRMAHEAFGLLEQAMNGERHIEHSIIPTRLIIRT